MPNNTLATVVEIEELVEDESGKDDFEFILGPDGELKSFSVPEHLMQDPPEEVMAILSLFGIDDLYEVANRILH